MDSIEKEFEQLQKKKAADAKKAASFGPGAGGYDQDLYGSGAGAGAGAGAGGADKYHGYHREIPADMEEPTERRSWTASKEILDDLPISADTAGGGHDELFRKRNTVADREGSYQARGRRGRMLSPERVDAFDKSQAGAGSEEARSYAEVMRETQLDREKQELLRKMEKQQLEEQERAAAMGGAETRKRRRWDDRRGESLSLHIDPALHSIHIDADPLGDDQHQAPPQAPRTEMESPTAAPASSKVSEWEAGEEEKSKPRSRWDQTPVAEEPLARKRSRWDETPVAPSASSEPTMSAWEATPKVASGLGGGETPRRSRWDETPVTASGASGPPASSIANTPFSNPSMYTPLIGHISVAPEQFNMIRFDAQDVRNRPLTDEEINALLPSEGYRILEPPAGYKPVMTPSRKLIGTPAPMQQQQEGFFMQQEAQQGIAAEMTPTIPVGVGGEELPHFKPEDIQFFGKLLDQKKDSELTLEEAKERKIMRLLLRIKNGGGIMRKASLKQIAEKARDFGAGPLFNQILPLLMSPTLEEQERHLLVKVIDRILYKLDDLVRPYVHKILVVIEPLLIDEDYYARIEGREIISNLSKAAGLATMISTMRPDIDHVDEYVRNTTARAFAVVASALGIPALLPFLKAVCKSKKSWQARHTGIKIIQQIAVLLGCAILPHLGKMVEAIAHGLEDEQQKVRTMTALAVSALAEAAAPYGIEAFDVILKPLWKGIRKHRGKSLAAFLKAIGFIIPLMDPEYANHYTREVMVILIREFTTPDEEMKKIVLKVVKQCSETEGVEPAYIKKDILPDFFRSFWIRRMALDKRNYRQLVETTVALAQKVGTAEIVGRLAGDLKDEAEPFRKMVVEAIDNVIGSLGKCVGQIHSRCGTGSSSMI